MKRIIGILLCLCLVLGSVSGCQSRENTIPDIDADSIMVMPDAQTDGMIARDSAMHVTFRDKTMSVSDAEKIFRFNPPVQFSVEKEKNGLLIKPETVFKENAVVNLQALDSRSHLIKSWAFQTVSDFSVLKTTPMNGGDYVPMTTGIEVQFSCPNVDVSAFEQHFSLKTSGNGQVITGHAEKFIDVLVFIPSQPLDPSTAYEAVISADLSTTDGTILGEAYHFSFKTNGGEGDRSALDLFENASPITETFISGDAPLIAVYCDKAYSETTPNMSVYRFRSAEDYTKTLSAYAAKRESSQFPGDIVPAVELGKLDSLGTFQGKLMTSSTDNFASYNMRYLPLPGDFDKGWYYIQVTATSPVNGKEKILHKFIQISDMSVYYAQADSSTLFWLNNAKTGDPVNGADIEILGDVQASGTSGENGTAMIQSAIPAKDERSKTGGVLTVRNGEDVFIDFYQTPRERPLTASERYVSYLYTDRPIYMSTDKVLAWGVVRPRAGTTEEPENLRLVFDRDDYLSVPVQLAPDGTFTAELPFEKMGGPESTGWSIKLKCGEDETLSSVYVDVGDYVKPVYVPSISYDKPIYQVGETAQFTFAASFFDNTPASNFSANLSVKDQSNTLTTDENGLAVLGYPIENIEEVTSWRPQNIWYSANNAGGENENFYISSYLDVLYRDIAVRGEVDRATNKVTVRTNQIDVSRIQKKEDAYDEDNLLGAAVDCDVSADLYKTYYTRETNGSYYDFIAKQNVTRYKYSRHVDLVNTIRFRTQNGVYELTDLPHSDADAAYHLELHTPDSKGRLVSEGVWLGYETYYYDAGVHNYSFLKQGEANQYSWIYKFREDEDSVYDVQDNGKLVAEGKILYILAQDGILDYGVEETPQVTLPFDEKLTPNYAIIGAYFDGKYIYRIASSNVSFDPQTRELVLDVKTDQNNYAPGGAAKVDVSVSYKKDGSPAADTAVSLSLVDEAVFAIRDSQAEPLTDLYRAVFEPALDSFASYIEYNFAGGSGGEKGGGGGDEGMRSDFKDTASFVSGTTDAQGHVRFDLALPDNITSWRATVQAVSKDLYAGDTRVPVVVTKNFFLNEVLPAQFLAGDQATVTLRSYGGAVQPDDHVDYTVTIEGNGQKLENTKSAKAMDLTSVPLGLLEKGDYTITMLAKSANAQDAVQKNVRVLESGVESWLVKTFDLKQGPIDISAEKFPVRIGFYNDDYQIYADVLEHVQSAGGARVDERIARQFAQDKIDAMSDEAERQGRENRDSLTDVITPSGYVSLFPYDSDSLPLAARVHLAIPDEVPGVKPVDVFNSTIGSILSDKSKVNYEQLAQAYLGLAAHKEPVLVKVREMLNGGMPLSDKAQLYLTAALAALGDVDNARNFYEKFVTPSLIETTTGKGQKALYMDVAGEINDDIEYTALASLTASMIRSTDADFMMVYLMSNRSTIDLYLLEEIVYLRYMEPQGGVDASVSYQRGGKTETLKLGKMGMRFVSFVSKDFEAADIRVKSGNVLAKVSYIGAVTEAAGQENQSIQLTRKFEVVGGGEMKPGSMVKITLQPVFPVNTIDSHRTIVNDFVPSGMRFLGIGDKSDVNAKSVWSYNWSVAKREGQRISFCYSGSDQEKRFDDQGNEIIAPLPGEKQYKPVDALVYYVRCAAPGDYIADSAFVRANTAPDWGVSEKTTVTIHE